MKMLNNFRAWTSSQIRKVLEKGGEDEFKKYARGKDLPPDRQGLLAVFHPLCVLTDLDVMRMNNIAEDVARSEKKRVYLVMNAYRWHLILFAYDDGSYDDEENGKYADDQFIGYYEPDGSFTFVGAS